MDDGIQAKIVEIDQRSKSNTHRINDLEEDIPGGKWEALVKATVTAIVGALVGFALAHAGIV